MATMKEADEDIVRALERAGVVLGTDEFGNVTHEYLLHGINRLASQASDQLGMHFTFSRRLRKANLEQSAMARDKGKLSDQLTALTEKYDKMSKYAGDQTHHLAVANYELIELRLQLKKFKKKAKRVR